MIQNEQIRNLLKKDFFLIQYQEMEINLKAFNKVAR
jgi:hypothetical protein